MIGAVAIGSDRFEDASREWSIGVQIVSRPADQFLNTNPRIRDSHRSRRVTAGSQFPREVTEMAVVDTWRATAFHRDR